MRIYYWDKLDNSEIYDLWYDIFQDSISFCNYYFKEKLSDNRIIVLEKKGSVASMLHMNPYKISLSGFQINAEYIVGVCTKNNYRGKGFLKDILVRSINDMYNEHIEFTFLTTVDENIYSRYDFRYISSCINSEFTKVKNQINIEVSLKNLTADLFDEFLFYYNKKMIENYDGYIIRDTHYMERILKEMNCENGHIKLFYKDGSIKGYIMLYIFETNIQVREIIYDTEILADMISYLQNMMDNNKTIRLLYFPEQRIEYIFQNYFDFYCEIKPYVMGRLVYINSFLERIKSKTPVDINIHIIDTILEQNNKTFHWQLSNQKSFLNETDNSEDIIIDIGTLTQWLCGYISITELIALNQIIIKNIDIIDSLKAVLIYKAVLINEVV